MAAQQQNMGRKKAAGGTRRVWSVTEEQELIHSLKDLVARGYKSENGFRTGYLSLLEQSMSQKFPGTDLKSEPHINSKIHAWKKFHASLSTMLSRSGIGFNDRTMQIEVNDDVWNEYIKVDTFARTMRFKSWPFYKDWIDIFGKDRATGATAEGFVDVVNELLNSSGDVNGSRGATSQVPTGAFNEISSSDFMSVCPDECTSEPQRKSNAKKRKNDDVIDERWIASMNVFCEKTDMRMGELAEKLGNLAERVGSQFDASKKCEAVFEALGDFEDLTLTTRVRCARVLCNNLEDLELFFSLPDDGKKVLVHDIMEKIGSA